MPEDSPTRREFRIAVVSDIHYAGAGEQARPGYFLQGLKSGPGRALLRAYKRFVWLKDPFAHNHLLEEFIRRASDADFVVANGDYSCDSGFIGVSDEPSFESARECLQRLRSAFGHRFQATIGDHEIGKSSLGGGQGGLRLSSFQRAVTELKLQPLWQVWHGNYLLLGIASTLAAFPVVEPESVAGEREIWRALHREHLRRVATIFAQLRPQQRVLLFCHDPTALAFLWREPDVQAHCRQIALTVIGHLHTQVVLWKSRLLAGMPVIRFLGTTPRRLSSALNQARCWRHFRVRLCPALAGTELLKDGGYCVIRLDPEAQRPPDFTFVPLAR